MTAQVAVVGSYGVGLTFDVDALPGAGETITCRSFAQHDGGKGSNQAVAAARLGARATLQTAIGDDPFGEGARHLWAEEGVQADPVVRAGERTMTAVVLVEADGENRIVIAPGALARFAPEDLDASLLASADVALVQLEIPLDTARHALQLARRAGVRTILNPAPAPPAATALGLLAAADIITPNIHEARRALGATTSAGDALADRLAARTGAAVVLTAGALGSYVADGGTVAHVAATAVARVVDSTGAGDAFSGALGVAVAEGADLTEAARFASGAAARCVARRGVVPGLPRRSELGAP